MTLILPAGVGAAWQDAIMESTPEYWDRLASDLLYIASKESATTRGNVLTLALIASDHAMTTPPREREVSPNQTHIEFEPPARLDPADAAEEMAQPC